MALVTANKVPASVPAHPSLALLSSLSAIAIDAAMLKRPHNPEPVIQLAAALTTRLDASFETNAAAAKLLDPETTSLLAAALQNPGRSVEVLVREGSEVAAALQQPLEGQSEATLRHLCDFALRLSAAAQEASTDDPLSRART